MVTPLRPDGSLDLELRIAMERYGYVAQQPSITPGTGTGYTSRAWLLEHMNAGQRHYKMPYYDDDPADGYPQIPCRQCHTAIINYGNPMCTKCVEKFKKCSRCGYNDLYLDWDYYHLDMCKKCLLLANGPCERCERPALQDTTRCHSHAKGNEVTVPKDRFWKPDFSEIEPCPVRPKMLV